MFAQAIRACLADHYSQQINYRLLACFGANNITPLAHSFGSKLATEMSAVGLKGSLTAYKGATGMDANLGKQIGSSRITCALSVLRHLGTMTGSQPTDVRLTATNLLGSHQELAHKPLQWMPEQRGRTPNETGRQVFLTVNLHF